jgi:hypothetical protein
VAVAFRSSSNTGNDASTTSRAPAVPAGAAAGDVVVVVLTRWTSDSAITAPSGFADWGTTYPAGTGGNTNANVHIFWKRLTGADTGTYSFSWTNNTGETWTHAHALCFSGCVSTGTPIEAVNNWAGTAGSYGSTSVTTVGAPGLIWSSYNDSSGTHTPPSSGTWTEVADFDSGSAAYRIPGASGTQTASGGSVTSSSPAAAVLIALAPEPSGSDLNLPDPSAAGIRAAVVSDSMAAGLVIGDASAGSIRAGSASASAAVGPVLADSSAAGIRAGNVTGEAAVNALVATDPGAGAARIGSATSTVVVGVIRADTAGAVRTGTSRDIPAASLVLADAAGAVRGGKTFGEAATSALVVLDPGTGQIRLGTVGGETAADVGELVDFVCQDFTGTATPVAYAGTSTVVTDGGTPTLVSYGGSHTVVSYGGTASICGR